MRRTRRRREKIWLTQSREAAKGPVEAKGEWPVARRADGEGLQGFREEPR
jgi:hypothetical protein